MSQDTSQSAAHDNLRLLCLLRVILLVGMFCGAWYLLNQGNVQLHWNSIFALLLLFILTLAITWLRSYRSTPIGDLEFLIHLLIDITLFSLIIFNTGGAANPFVSYLLVPLTIAAITLPASLTWLTGFVSLLAYSLLLFWYIPVPLISPAHSTHGAGALPFNPHLTGMWITFAASAALISYFANRMATVIARQERTLNRQKQKQLEDDQLLAVASLAASAAHELGTPLNTMQLVIDDWGQGNNPLAAPCADDIALLRSQVTRCQKSLQRLSGTARSYTHNEVMAIPVKQYFEDLLDSWLIMRPDVKATIQNLGNDEGAAAHLHPALTASLYNLLNNAADASPHQVDISVDWDRSEARFTIRDYGSGLDIPDAGQSPIESAKPGGMGLGLFLARSILERHNGSVLLSETVEGGVSVEVRLPLAGGNGVDA